MPLSDSDGIGLLLKLARQCRKSVLFRPLECAGVSGTFG